MIFTIIFYIILALLGFCIKNRVQALKAMCIFIAVYTSLRYNYPSDYPAYEYVFNQFANSSYIYDPDIDHFEEGWYLINRFFAPFGYYAFVAFCSCLFAYSIYLVCKIFVPNGVVTLVLLGIVSVGGFTTLLSAQRQLLVTAIFLISFYYLLYNRINKLRDLVGFNVIVYWLIVYICSYFHSSALFLLIIPFFFVLPNQSTIVVLGIVVTAALLLLLGNSFLPKYFTEMSENLGYYDHLNFSGEYSGSITVLQASIWLFQLYYVVFIYKKVMCNNSEKAVLLISLFSILITISGYSLGQIARLSHYIYIFTFLVIGIIFDKLRYSTLGRIFILVNTIWVVWNLFKVFSIPVGTLHEYKFLLFK